MASHRAPRVPSVSTLRTAASTLLLTGVASAATVLVLTQASSTFTGTWSDRADGAVAVGGLPPITVPISPRQPSVAGSPAVHTPPAPIATPTKTPIPTPIPTATVPSVLVVDRTPTTRPTPTPAADPTHGTGQPGSGTPTVTLPRTPVVSLGEVGTGGGKTFDSLPKTQGGAVSLALGEVGHFSLCTGQGVNRHCGIGYDNASPTSPTSPTRAARAPVPAPVLAPVPVLPPVPAPVPAPPLPSTSSCDPSPSATPTAASALPLSPPHPSQRSPRHRRHAAPHH